LHEEKVRIAPQEAVDARRIERGGREDTQSGDNNTPTVFVLPVSVVQIPTLGTWGLLALAALLNLFAMRRLTRPARG
jgi:hypothetical protein